MPRPRDITTTLTTFVGTETIPVDQAAGNLAKITAANVRKWFGNGAVNALDYGAARNGVADDRAAIHAALADSDTVILPGPGTYLVSDRVEVGSKKLIGVGDPVIKRTTAGSVVQLWNDGAELHGLKIDGTGATYGVEAISSDQVIEGCEIYGAATGVLIYNSGPCRVEGCEIRNVVDNGIKVEAAAPCLITGNDIHDVTHGQGVFVNGQFVATTGNMGHRVTGNTIYNINATSGSGEWGNGVLVFLGGQVTVSSNVIHDTDFSFVRVNEADGVDVAGNICWNSGETGLFAEFEWRNVTFRGNSVQVCAADAIVFANGNSDGGKHGVAAFNTISGTPKGIVTEGGTIVAGNVIDVTGDFGIRLGYGGCWDIDCHSNLITDTQATPTLKVGIVVENAGGSTQRNVSVHDNIVTNATLAPVGGHDFADVTNGAVAYAIPAYATVKAPASDGAQTLAYAASITPNPFNGGTVIVGALTGNITVNTPTSGLAPGQRMTLVFTQDATGGRTITLPAAWFFNWTPTTTASHKNTITVAYDGSSWVQVAGTTGLT